MPSARPPSPATSYPTEVLRDLEKTLRRQADIGDRMLEIMQESHLTTLELVKVLKDFKREVVVRGPDPVQSEILAVLKGISAKLDR